MSPFGLETFAQITLGSEITRVSFTSFPNYET